MGGRSEASVRSMVGEAGFDGGRLGGAGGRSKRATIGRECQEYGGGREKKGY